MAIRDELFSINDIVDQSQNFLNSTEALRQQAAKGAINRAVQTGETNPLRLAGLAFEAGDPTALRNIINNQTKPQKSSIASFTPEEISTVAQGLGIQNMTPQLAQTLSKVPANTASGLLKSTQGGEQFNRGESRRNAQFSLSQEKQTSSELSAFEKAVEDRLKVRKKSLEDIDQVLKIAPVNFAGVDRVLLTTTARSIGKDVGNIAVQEAQQILPRTAFQDWQSVVSYVTNTAPSKVPDEIKGQLIEIFKIVRQKQEDVLKAEAAKNVESIGNAKRKRLVRNGSVDPSVSSVAQRYGVDVKVDENGVIKAAPGQGILSVDQATSTIPANSKKGMLLQKASKISDPTQKANAIQAISSASEDQLTEATVKQFESLIQQYGGQ